MKKRIRPCVHVYARVCVFVSVCVDGVWMCATVSMLIVSTSYLSSPLPQCDESSLLYPTTLLRSIQQET